MNVEAWCGACGQSFRLVEVVAAGGAGRPGHCPRCDAAFAEGYTAVLAGAVQQLLAGAGAVEDAAKQLAEVAPHLHVDHRRLTADLAAELDH